MKGMKNFNIAPKSLLLNAYLWINFPPEEIFVEIMFFFPTYLAAFYSVHVSFYVSY